MNSISLDTLNSLDQFNAGQKQQLFASSQVNLAAISREQSADISLVTKEGDKVTLAADSSFEAAYATYDRQARMNGAYTESRGRLSSVNFEREITIRVEGDLNSQEQKEIKKVLHIIFKMMKDYLSGKNGKPTGPVVKGIKLDTFANFEAKFEITQSALEFNHTSAEYVTNSSISKNGSDRERDARSMDRLIDRMSKAVKHSKIEQDRFLKYFEHEPSGMVDKYMELEPDGRKMRKMLRRIIAELFHELEKMKNIAKEYNHSETPAKEDSELAAEHVA